MIPKAMKMLKVGVQNIHGTIFNMTQKEVKERLVTSLRS